MIIRENYLQKIRPFYEQDLIKFITGIRRCGKSVILTQIIDEIKQNNRTKAKQVCGLASLQGISTSLSPVDSP